MKLELLLWWQRCNLSLMAWDLLLQQMCVSSLISHPNCPQTFCCPKLPAHPIFTKVCFTRQYIQAHDAEKEDCAATLRMLHYHDITGSTFPANYWRAAPHADFDTITLLFQRPGQGGLEVFVLCLSLAGAGPITALADGQQNRPQFAQRTSTFLVLQPMALACFQQYSGVLVRRMVLAASGRSCVR